MSNRIELIDWAVAYRIEKAFTQAGLYPDRDLYLPNNQAGFDSALAAIVAANGFYVETKSWANFDARGEAGGCDVVIARKSISPSRSNHLNSNLIFADNGNGFDRKEHPQTPYDLEYEVRLLASTVRQERVCGIVLGALAGMGVYIPLVDVVSESRQLLDETVFFKMNGSTVDLSGTGYIEKIWRFSVEGAQISDDIKTMEVPAMSEFNFIVSATNIGGGGLSEL